MLQVMETIGNTINVSDLMERWILDVIGKAGFGKTENKVHINNK